MGTLAVDKLLKTSTGAAEFTLPATDGTAGQVMQTDGSGQLSVAALATDSVTATQIAANAVGNSEMADDAVGLAELSATGTASASTFLRGDNSWATPSGGKILQVVYASYATQVTTGTTPVSTGTTATITPASSSNKIIVFATMNGLQKDNSNANGRITLQVDRGGTLIHNVQANLWNYTAQTFRDGGFSILYVDSPSSTSAVVYTIKLAAADVVACYVNKDSNSGASYITLMEIE